jgi:sRNA-binding regulator protein Hfq
LDRHSKIEAVYIQELKDHKDHVRIHLTDGITFGGIIYDYDDNIILIREKVNLVTGGYCYSNVCVYRKCVSAIVEEGEVALKR